METKEEKQVGIQNTEINKRKKKKKLGEKRGVSRREEEI